jgi:hypothetical protein
LPQRQVEAEVMAHHCHRFRGGGAGLAGQHVGGISGHELQQGEVQHHDGNDRGYGLSAGAA